MTKRNKWALLLTLFAVIMFCFAGCGQKENDDYYIVQEDVAILVNDSLNLCPVGYLNGEKLNGAEFTFVSLDETIVVCENDLLKSTKVGETTVTVTMKYEGKRVATKNIKITVNENEGIVPNRASYQLYMVSSFRGVKFEKEIDLSAKYYKDGNAQLAEGIEWETADTSIAAIEDGKIVAKSLGKTYLTGTYVTDKGDVLKTKALEVSVDTAIVDTSLDVIIDLQKNEQNFYAPSILGENSKIGKIVNSLTGTAYTLQNGVLPTPSILSGEYRFTIYSENSFVASNVDMVVADYVIYDVEDMLELAKMTEGYIVLANDIDGVEYIVEEQYYGNAYSNYNSFSGTFNGLGHTVSNLTLMTPNCGLVCSSAGATWKNVAFVDVVFKNNTVGLFAYKSKNSNTIDNVYISMKKYAPVSCGTLFALVENGSVSVKNTIIESQVDVRPEYNGLLFGRSTYINLQLDNAIILGNGALCSVQSHSLNLGCGAINSTANVIYKNDAAVRSAVKDGVLTFKGFNKYWNLSGDIPVFKEQVETGEKDDVLGFDPDWIN